MFNFLSPLYWIFVFLLFGFLGGSRRTYQKLVHRSLPLSRVGDYSAILGGPWAGGAGLKLGCWICQAPCSGIIFLLFGFLGGSVRTIKNMSYGSLSLSRTGDYNQILGGP